MDLYRHYKGKLYALICFAKNSETLEEMVVYQAQYGEKAFWVRPKKMFFEIIDIKGERVPRFKKVEQES